MLPKILREISDTNSIVVVSLAQPGAALSIKKSGIRVIKAGGDGGIRTLDTPLERITV
jgi:hypothetical protein